MVRQNNGIGTCDGGNSFHGGPEAEKKKVSLT
jgi:hypothetical protein